MMCSGSRAPGRGGSAFAAGTPTQQLLEGIDPRTVAVAPVNPETVGTDQSQAQRFDVGRHRSRVEQWTPADLFDAAGTGTGQPKQSCREKGLVTPVIPFDEDAVVAAVDGVWNREHGESWELGARSRKDEDPPRTRGLCLSSQLPA